MLDSGFDLALHHHARLVGLLCSRIDAVATRDGLINQLFDLFEAPHAVLDAAAQRLVLRIGDVSVGERDLGLGGSLLADLLGLGLWLLLLGDLLGLLHVLLIRFIGLLRRLHQLLLHVGLRLRALCLTLGPLFCDPLVSLLLVEFREAW